MLALPATVAADIVEGAWQPGPARYAVGVDRNVAVTMADGTVLRVDVHHPVDRASGLPAEGPFPVILTQTPYGKGPTSSALGGSRSYFVERGYIHVVADVRGTGASRGAWGLLDPVQGHDGAELVRWAAELPHADGGVAGWGPSYLGDTQIMTAAEVGPGSPLKAIFPIVASHDLYREIVTAGGLPNAETTLPYLGFTGALNTLNPVIDGPTDPAELLRIEAEHAEGTLATQVELPLEVLLDGDRLYDGPYWADRRRRDQLSAVVENGIPAFLVGGWFDAYQRGSPLNYAGLQNAWAGRPVGAPMLPGQAVTGRYQLLMGPWYHNETVDLPAVDRIALRWFDNWLKGEPTGIEDQAAPFHAQILGTGRWSEVARYPFTEAPHATYWLRDGGRLSREPPSEAAGEDSVAWTGVSSPCSRSTVQWSLGVLAQDPYCQDDNRTTHLGALTYTSEPLADDAVIAGPIAASIHMTSTRPETQLVVTVEDVAPGGRSTALTSGLLLGSQRALDEDRTWTDAGGRPILPYHPHTRTAAEPVPAGAVTRFDVEVFPTVAQLARGHRLRVTIATADTPHVLPTPGQLAGLVGGVYRVQRNASAASSIQVPLAPADAFGVACEICPAL